VLYEVSQLQIQSLILGFSVCNVLTSDSQDPELERRRCFRAQKKGVHLVDDI
jgi:hypothetical protein